MRRRSREAPLAALLLAAAGARAEEVVGDFVIRIAGSSPVAPVLVSRANTAPVNHAGSKPLALIEAEPADACADLRLPPGVEPGGFVLLVARGGCNFEHKVAAGARARAAAVVVYNTVSAAYVAPNASYALNDQCAVDCAQGEFRIKAPPAGRGESARAQGFPGVCHSACASGQCAAAGILPSDDVQPGDALTLCCLPDELMVMNLNPPTDASEDGEGDAVADVPALFARRADAGVLLAAARSRQQVFAEDRPRLPFEPSVLLMWATGVFAVVAASWAATGRERAYARSLPPGVQHKGDAWQLATGAGEPAPAPAEDETVDLTSGHALAFAAIASVSLVCMFVLLQLGAFWIIRIVQVLFCLGCVSALFQFAFFPLVVRLRPGLARISCGHTAALGTLTAADLVALSLAAGLVGWYFAERHSGYAWVLQDLMALAMCAMFLKTVRLPNVRVAGVLLVVFFLYDIFMVFVSPLIFRKSVMVEVATAGAGGQSRSVLSDDGRVCQHIEGERMPVLFMIPRLDFGGGYSMLGLGDVVMPGLLVCLCLRYDCATRAPSFVCGEPADGRVRCCGRLSYFVLVSVGYAVGLAMALLANVLGLTFNGVRGQPALLYLVPLTLGPVLAFAGCRGDIGDLWNADDLLDKPDADSTPPAYTAPYTAHQGAAAQSEELQHTDRWSDARASGSGAVEAGDRSAPAGNGATCSGVRAHVSTQGARPLLELEP